MCHSYGVPTQPPMTTIHHGLGGAFVYELRHVRRIPVMLCTTHYPQNPDDPTVMAFPFVREYSTVYSVKDLY